MRQATDVETAVAGIRAPGSLLAEQREEYGWSIRDVASAMRLSERQIEAIEADDYDSLPGKTYVMGYWRSYSQLLRIDIDDSIQIHRSNLATQIREISVEPSPSQVKGNDEQSRKRVAALFACLLAVFLGAVWYWQDPDPTLGEWVSGSIGSLTGTSEEPAAVPDPVEPLVLPEPEIVAPTESVLALPEPNFSEGQEAVAINTRGYEVLIAELPLSRRDLIYQPWPESEEESASPGDARSQAASNEGEGATTPEDNAAVLAAAAAEAAARRAREAAARAAAQQAAAANQATRAAEQSSGQSRDQSSAQAGGQIAFQVASESWIDVRDSTGERLIYRTVNRGEDIRLRGIPPYSVFIGSAEGVSVQYQGQPVPFKIHESGLFARFEVGR